jgi:hypothetical protein
MKEHSEEHYQKLIQSLRRQRMRLIVTEYDKGILIKLLGERGRELQKKKQTEEEKKELQGCQRLIHQLAFGRNDRQ